MNFYFAPMEGLTGYIYRNANNAFFNKIDKYFSPFIVANQSNSFKPIQRTGYFRKLRKSKDNMTNKSIQSHAA